MSLLVAIRGWTPEPWIARLRQHVPQLAVVSLDDPFDQAAVRYAATWKHPPGALAGLPNLKAVFSLGAGVDHVLRDPALPRVPVARVVDADLTHRMVEYVVWHCLALLRQARRYARQQAEHIWLDDRGQPSAREVRVGIMGLGVMGAAAAQALVALGFDVAGWSRTPRTLPQVASYAGQAELPAFLARTDLLVVLLPHTPETLGIISTPLLRGLARDGRLGAPALINAGRGGLQREVDLLACLADGTLGHVVLDVFETEPLPTDSPLWDHPKVTLTPHNAAVSDPDAICALIGRQIDRLERGLPLEHEVDVARGY